MSAVLDIANLTALRMRRQHLTSKASAREYDALYRDLQPGLNVYWNGFGDPPSLTFRADFEDIQYNRGRQARRELIKGRFQGGNLGWIAPGELPLFAALYRKPLDRLTEAQRTIFELIQREGPMNIALMKEFTGMLAKHITPALHRLQEAFWVYEDQYDGEWDRAWYPMDEMFPDADLDEFTRQEALKTLIGRFAYRQVWFDGAMAHAYFKLPMKEIRATLNEMAAAGILIAVPLPIEESKRGSDVSARDTGMPVALGTQAAPGYMSPEDHALLEGERFETTRSVFAMHRNDFLVKSNEHWLKPKFYPHADSETPCDVLQYLLIDGEFRGAVLGRFKNGPYVIEDVVLDRAQDFPARRDEIIEAVYAVNDCERSPIKRYEGEKM